MHTTGARSGRRIGPTIAAVLVALFMATGCGGDDDDEATADAGSTDQVDDGSTDAGGGGGDGGDDGGGDGEFRLGQAGWENTCTVLGEDEVAEATGFTVTGSEEAGGCTWSIDQVDSEVISDHAIGWQPQSAGTFEAQRVSATEVDSSIVIEPIDGIGNDAFWQGVEDSPLGEVWVQLDDLDFRITNQFASGSYTGEVREPMEALAAAVAEALQDVDIEGVS